MHAVSSKTTLPQRYWGIIGAICIAGAIVSWFMVDKSALAVTTTTTQDEVAEEIQVEAVTANKTLGSLTKEVPPLELKKRVVAINGDHGANFRGTKFMQTNQKMWTVELFRATEEQVVLDYMQHHADEKELFYTRLSGDNQEELYVVFYGKLKTKEGAQRLANQLVTLDLPKTLTPEAKPFSDYVKLVNEVGSEEGMTGINRLYDIHLRPVALPRPAETTSVATPSTTNASNPPAVRRPVEPATRVVRPTVNTEQNQ